MTDSNSPNSTKRESPFDSLLAQCRDLVSERLSQALGGMLEKMDETLSELIHETPDHALRKLYVETKDKALKQRKAIAEQFRALYLREFHVRSNRVKKIGQSFSDLDASSLELDLVGEDDLNETLRVNDMATKLRQYCDDELIALDQRIGVLLGDANLGAEDNPFSPQAICDAFKNTCRSLVTDVKVRMIFLKLFDDHVLDDIRSVYKAVNSLLVQNSILPKIRYGVSRGKEGSKAPPPGARSGEEPPAAARAAETVRGGETDFFSVLQNLLASSVKAMTQSGVQGGTGVPTQGAAGIPGFPPVTGASAQGVTANPGFPPIQGAPGLVGAAGAPMVVLQGAELMNLLTRVQHGEVSTVADGGLPRPDSAGEPGTTNVLRELKATSVGSGMNQMDVVTLDIVAMLFDQLFDDPKIPIGVKGLIGRMQIPILKVAIADKAFFSKKSHPARQLLDSLGEISSRLPTDFNASNPLFGRLDAIIQELIKDFQDDMEIFDVVRQRLQVLFDEEHQRVEQETLSAAKRIEQDESLAASKTMAEFEVKARVQAGNLPRPVIEFLVHQWVKPLLIVHVRRGQHSDAWKNTLATMDLLIWSVEAKHTPEERSKLAEVVPDLLKRLAAGLKIADTEDAIRERFFSDLEKLHSGVAGVVGDGEVAEAPDAGAETGVTPDIVFTGVPVSGNEETAELIPATADQVPEPSSIGVLESKEIVPPAHELAIELPEQSPNEFAEPKEGVSSIHELAIELPEHSPVESVELKEIVPPSPAAAFELTDLPPMELLESKEGVPATRELAIELPDLPQLISPEPKQTEKPIPVTASEIPELPSIHFPEPRQTVKPIPATAGPANAPSKTPAQEPRQPVKPTPATAGPPIAPPRTPVPGPGQPFRAPPPSTQAPVPPGTPVVEPRQTVKPILTTAGPGVPPGGKPVPLSREPVKTIAPSPPANKAMPASTEKVKAIPTPAPRAPAPASRSVPAAMPTSKSIAPSTPRASAPVAAQDADSFSLDFTKSITIKNPFGGGKVNVKELDSDDEHAATAPRAKGEANEMEFIKNLKEGTWVEFLEKGGKETRRRAKLSFISPLRSRFLFVDKLGKTVKECSRTELGGLVRLGLVVVVVAEVVDAAPLFDRMMAGVIGKLK